MFSDFFAIVSDGSRHLRLTLKERLTGRSTTARFAAAERLGVRSVPASDDTDNPTVTPGDATTQTAPADTALDAESAQWVKAHNSTLVGDEVPPSTALIFADQNVQDWMAQTLTLLGWDVTEPVMLLEGWVPARNETLETGQPVTTYATPSKTSAAFARKNDPKSSKTAGATAAANQSVTVNSHQGRLLRVYEAQHVSNAGVGFTAAEAVNAADLLTDGAHGSPWHRVTDLRDMGLITYLLDSTGQRVTRKNGSNSEGQVLVITPLGQRACAALSALAEHGYTDYPLNFDGPTDDALFEDLPATLARIEAMPPIPATTD
jgi:hypothetical protein